MPIKTDFVAGSNGNATDMNKNWSALDKILRGNEVPSGLTVTEDSILTRGGVITKDAKTKMCSIASPYAIETQLATALKLSDARFAKTGCTVNPSDTITYNGVILEAVTFTDVNGRVFLNDFSGIGVNWWDKYIVSFYAVSVGRPFLFKVGGYNSATSVFSNNCRRFVPTIGNNPKMVVYESLGSVAAPSGSAGLDIIRNSVDTLGMGLPTKVYVGGLQLTKIPELTGRGIAGIGDSTMDNSTDGNELIPDWVRLIGAYNNANTFNRGVGGERTDQMDARWGTSISPIKGNCKYVIIQGGINDVSQGRTYEQITGSITSMETKAIADGLIPVFATISPSNTFDDAKNLLRSAINTWVRAKQRYIDIDLAVADPQNPNSLNPLWAGDGVHYTNAGRMAVANMAIAQGIFDFSKPTNLNRVE